MIRHAAVVLVLGLVAWTVVRGQQARSQATHVTIPFLANATKPDDLDFQGGQCDVSLGGRTMTCRFQQLFLTTSGVVPDTCLVTTNRYELVFKKEANARWTSSEGPQGVCGIMDVTTLLDEGGVRWTMEMHKVVTRKDAAPVCRQIDERPESLSWQNIRRSLPCRFVQPGDITR